MVRSLFVSFLVFGLVSCVPVAHESVYYWKTTLDWSDTDSKKWDEAGADRLGLRLFDWGDRGEEGPLTVRTMVPTTLEVVPVVYVTTARLAAWAADPALDAGREAALLLGHMDAVLGRAWVGRPEVWQLDADWSGQTRKTWFAVAAAFGDLVHARGARFEVTVRLHQYRDRLAQGVPPADAGVLMLYGVGDAILDPALVEGYLKGPPYPLPLTAAFPAYVQVRQLNGYGRLVALHRLGARATLPLDDLKPLGGERFEVVRRSTLAGRPLLAHDVLAVDRVSAADLARVAALPAVARLGEAGRVWWFDYDPEAPVPRLP
jgi:hypothetical protein